MTTKTTKQQVEAQSKMILRLENRLTTLENKVADLNTIKNAATLASGRFPQRCADLKIEWDLDAWMKWAEKTADLTYNALVQHVIQNPDKAICIGQQIYVPIAKAKPVSITEAIRVIREHAEKNQLYNGDALALYGILAKREIS